MTVKNPDLLPLFGEVKQLLEPYAGELSLRRDEPGAYELWSDKQVEIEGRIHKDGVFFVGLLIQKHFVGLYYMPVYTHEEAAAFIGADLMKLLKGKSCFQLKRLSPELTEQIKSALAEGLKLYRSRGWI